MGPMMAFTRRAFLSTPLVMAQRTRRPNVVLLISDDQGYGDLSIHSNQHLKTPNLDSIGRSGVQFTQFQVCPVCSPTRSSLMTGRYNYRTGVVDTYLGRSMMYPDEVTLPETLSKAGYRTGIFGKWHLGDNYPLRSIDQGFQESLVHLGGGLMQPSDPPGNTYYDPVLQHNGKAEKKSGYYTDIFFNAAMQFIEKHRGEPFFTYIATNAPHTPLQVDDALVEPFRRAGLDDTTAKVYGMVRNLDDNAGRLLAHLKKLNLENDTILIFMTDNGPQQDRYNAGMRGRKGTVYQGGIRVPFFVRWPGKLRPSKVDRIAAHIDVMPTLLDVCGAAPPEGLKIDGRSLWPLLRGTRIAWPDRTLYTQWHRGDQPERFRACAARTQQYKLVDGKELYDLTADPAERSNVATAHPDIVTRMRQGYDRWFDDVSSTRGYDPPRIHLGTPHENPVTLTRQDWRGPQAGWEADSVGHWEVDVATPGNYDVAVRTFPAPGDGAADFALNGVTTRATVEQGSEEIHFPNIRLEKGKGRLEAVLSYGGKRAGARYVDVKKLS